MPGSADGTFDVLHVDDDAALLSLSEELLAAQDGIRVQTATDPEAVIDLLADGAFECVVSDYQMPVMDGLELLAEVREIRPQLPFILFTGKGSEDIASEAISAGVTDYIQKRTGAEQWEMLANKIRRGVEHSRTEQALRESEERYRTLVERSHDAIYIYQDGDFVFVNDRTCDLLGYDEEALIGRPIREVLHPEVRDDVMDNVRRRMDGEDVPQTYRTRIVTSDGEARHISVSVQSLTYQGSLAVLGSARNVTDQVQRERQLQRERDRRSALFENIAVPIVYFEYVDGEPMIREVNPAFEETFGYEESAITGQRLDDVVVPSEYAEEGEDINERVRAGQIVDTEVVRQTADEQRLFHLLSVPLSPGKYDEPGYAVYTDVGTPDDRSE